MCHHYHHHHHHQFLLLLVEHGASMKSFQALWSPAIPLTSFHDLPVFLISSSIVLRHVLFSLPLLLYPWGFQCNTVFSIALASLHNVCLIQFYCLLFIWISMGNIRYSLNEMVAQMKYHISFSTFQCFHNSERKVLCGYCIMNKVMSVQTFCSYSHVIMFSRL